ncbi:uncharacterized protein LOC130745087 [Lotus japonicus]|uniref:uncharacterized protein LOC130745087 n=1 Tax=Lotus japonicus TaxID=34305 RepID=UPI002587AE84|nr:uncharacterized protein LOC130745087 [Lotus japonicus]
MSPSYEEEVAFDMNMYPSYDETFHENEAETISSHNHTNNNNGMENHLQSIVNEEIIHEFSHEGNVAVQETQQSKQRRVFLDNNQRKIISEVLINSCSDGKLNRGTVAKLASLYSVSTYVIYRIWKQTKEIGDVCHKRTKNCGRKRVEIDLEKALEVPLAKRSSLRSLACALGLKSKTTLEKYLKEGKLRRHSSSLNPHLKDDNMKARLRFCFNMLDENSIPHNPMFKSMYNVVHIDEKWFYMTKKSMNYYLLAAEDDPHRTIKNKNYIQKVMFLAAMARPRFNDEGNATFTGKIGVFPLVEKVPARRSSVNRAAGTLETKPITSITKEVSRMFLINKVLPAIKEKWPREHAHEPIFIQQDNAPCHVSPDDEEFHRASSEGGFNICLTCQPANSPDLNVLDLGFFSAIQSLQQKKATKTVDELIEVVEDAYENFDCKSSNKIFLTLQTCMVEIMKEKGSNRYKIPHMKKDVLLAQGKLPTQLECDPDLVHEVHEYLLN